MLTRLEKSVIINATPEKIFSFVSSERMNEVWGDEMIGKWVTKGPVRVGTIGRFQTKGTIANFGELTGEVTEFEINKKMTMRSKDAKGKMDSTDTLIIEPTPKGTKTTYVTQYKVPYSVFGKLIDKVKISKDMEAMHIKWLENLKKALEA
jgi:uncharacterized protein YndB with AHSA1/START domain